MDKMPNFSQPYEQKYLQTQKEEKIEKKKKKYKKKSTHGINKAVSVIIPFRFYEKSKLQQSTHLYSKSGRPICKHILIPS